MKKKKILVLFLFLIAGLGLTACSKETETAEGTFENIDDADLPDTLETVVGTVDGVYYSDGIKDADYKAVFNVTYKDTTEADYNTLMEHYEQTSVRTDKSNDTLQFDWGSLQVTNNSDTITVNALIK